MEIVKKNIVSIVCGVIAIVALLALAWPVSGMYAETQGELGKRAKVFNDLNVLLKSPRTWPVIPDVESGDKTSLHQCPTPAAIDEAERIKNRVSKQAEEMQKLTMQQNLHDLLVADILPN